MPFEIEVSKEAEIQIFEAYFYYYEISESLAKQFNSEVINVIDYLEENPEYFQNRYREIKIVFLKKFPYSIHYITKSKTVFVLKVLHQKQLYK